jgi:UPF0176 protein
MRKTISFYKYTTIKNPQETRDQLFAMLNELDCRGRIYVAHEGINAQMNVPAERWEAFETQLRDITEFADVEFKHAVEESESFKKLTIKVKDKIVADGLNDSSFDLANTGSYVTAKQMNEYIENPGAVVVDMRNRYESEIGHFESAHLPQVDSFREELAIITDELADKKDAPIALYCTGGIRCEKASAWMKHKGFSNVSHLKGGIINYAHAVQEQGIENKFKGKNFVFDERHGERVGDEIISMCHLCEKNKSDEHYNCAEFPCNALFIGCEDCIQDLKGFCSSPCQSGIPRDLNSGDSTFFRKRVLGR